MLHKRHSDSYGLGINGDDWRSKLMDFAKRKWWLVIIAGVLLVAVLYFGYNYIATRNELAQINSSQDEAQKLTGQIGKYIDLPKDTPTLATVDDASKLSSQEFFKNAQNGDKVLIFSTSGRALLYRPSTQKVIEYSKVSLGASQQKP